MSTISIDVQNTAQVHSETNHHASRVLVNAFMYICMITTVKGEQNETLRGKEKQKKNKCFTRILHQTLETFFLPASSVPLPARICHLVFLLCTFGIVYSAVHYPHMQKRGHHHYFSVLTFRDNLHKVQTLMKWCS